MDPVVVGVISVLLIVLLIYCGSYVAITLSIVSFAGVWLLRGDVTIAMRMMTLAVTDSIKSYDFASIPTFVMMGFIVGKSGIGADIYEVFHHLFRRARGGLGIATVAANAAFAAVTGSSIASA
jgi:TRAP-type mannitol/chloroaromatic compound transport system permease large subunit